MKKRLSQLLVVLPILLSLILAGCSPRTLFNSSGSANAATPSVRLTRGPLTVTVSAVGNVRSGQSAIIAWQTSGKVGEVLVRIGQQVSAGEVLARLDPSSLPQTILQAQVDRINAQRALDDLKEVTPLELAQAEAAVKAAQKALDDLLNPTDLLIAQAEQAVLKAQEALDKAQREYDRLLYPRGSDEAISIANADYLLAQQNVDRLQEIYNQTPGNPETNLAKAQALSNLNQAKRLRDRALANLNWLNGKPTEEDIAEKKSNLALAQARLADAQKTLQELTSPSEVDLALARARLEDAQKTLDKLKNGPSQEDLTIAETRLTQALAVLKLGWLEAPFAGSITNVEVLPGDIVSPGKTAFRLDDLSALFVDLQVSEVDVFQVQVGQPVSVTFDAILDKTYQGVVDEISQVGQNLQGVVSFTVTVRLLDADAQVKPGMTAVANIRVSERDNVLQLPNRAIKETDGKRFVYRITPSGTEQIFVQVGATSDTASEVISDELREGDEIALEAPLFSGGQPEGVRQNRDFQDSGQP